MRLVSCFVIMATFGIVLVSLQTASAQESTTARQRFEWTIQNPEYKAVFDEVHKSGAAWISVGRSPRDRCFSDIPSDVIEPLGSVCKLAQLLCFLPHRLGPMDAMALAAPMLDNYSSLMELDVALYGQDEDCTAELLDSPSLMTNLELLSRLPELRQLTVYTKRTDDRVMKAIHKVKVSDSVRLRDPVELAKKSGCIMGTVVDQNDKPVAGATVMIYTRDGELVLGSWTNDDGAFADSRISNIPYRIQAFASPSWLAAVGSPVASSAPVDAESGDRNVRLVIDPAKLASRPPSVITIEDDNGGRRRSLIAPERDPESQSHDD